MKKERLRKNRELAKLGLTATLSTCVITSFFMKNKAAKTLHIASGVALVGFSFWHHSLYGKKVLESSGAVDPVDCDTCEKTLKLQNLGAKKAIVKK